MIMSVHANKLQHDFDVNVSRLPLGMTEQDMQYIDLFNHNGCLDFANFKTKKLDMHVHSFRLLLVFIIGHRAQPLNLSAVVFFKLSAIVYTLNIIICWLLTWNYKPILSTHPRTQGKSRTIQTQQTSGIRHSSKRPRSLLSRGIHVWRSFR